MVFFRECIGVVHCSRIYRSPACFDIVVPSCFSKRVITSPLPLPHHTHHTLLNVGWVSWQVRKLLFLKKISLGWPDCLRKRELSEGRRKYRGEFCIYITSLQMFFCFCAVLKKMLRRIMEAPGSIHDNFTISSYLLLLSGFLIL